MTSPDPTAVEQAFAAVASTQADLYVIDTALDDRTGELAHQLRLYGLQLQREGVLVDPKLIHRLYWETPSLTTQAIFEAFALRSPGDAYRIAGPHELDLPCKDCQLVITYTVKNRTQLAKLRSNHRCADCTAKVDERKRLANERSDAQWEQSRREEDEAVREAMVAYVLAHPELPTEPEGEAMYVDIDRKQGWGGTTVRLGALNALQRELRERLQPRN